MKKRNVVIPVVALITSIIAVSSSAAIVLTSRPDVNSSAASANIHSKIKEAARLIKPTEPETQPETEPAEPQTEPKTEAQAEQTESLQTEQDKPAAEEDKIMEAARKAVEKCTESGMTKEEKLKNAFDYLKKNYLEGVRRSDYREIDWPAVYAGDLLIGGKGDCFSYGAAFAYMAKAIGYEECYACNSGGHGWAEVDGKIYDPEWSMHSSKYSYFGMSYDDPCDVAYKGSIGWADWTHVKV